MCSRNCSGRGSCYGVWCMCDRGYITDDCSGAAVLPGTSEYSYYQGMRWTVMLPSFLLAAVSAQRLVMIARSKARQQKRVPSLRDHQLQTITLNFIACVLNGVVWLDFFSLEGIFDQIASSTMFEVMICIIGVAVARFLQFFVVLYSRFHPPSRKTAFALNALCVVFFISQLVTEPFSWISLLAHTIHNACAVLFVIVLTLVGSIYAVTVLNPSSDALVQRSQREEEIQTRRTLRRVIRGLQIVALFAISLSLWSAVAYPVTVETTIALDWCWSMVAVLSCAAMIAVMGRAQKQDNDNRVHPTIATTALQTIATRSSPVFRSTPQQSARSMQSARPTDQQSARSQHSSRVHANS